MNNRRLGVTKDRARERAFSTERPSSILYHCPHRNKNRIILVMGWKLTIARRSRLDDVVFSVALSCNIDPVSPGKTLSVLRDSAPVKPSLSGARSVVPSAPRLFLVSRCPSQQVLSRAQRGTWSSLAPALR